jgi:hypothetical protein
MVGEFGFLPIFRTFKNMPFKLRIIYFSVYILKYIVRKYVVNRMEFLFFYKQYKNETSNNETSDKWIL